MDRIRKINKCLSVQDLQGRAKRYLPRVIYDYLEGGADDEQCLLENVERIRRHRLRPRYMIDISVRCQEVTVFGVTYAAPLGISPMGMLGMVRDGGDLMLADVAAASRIPFILSGASNASIASITQRAADSWLQYYPCKDQGIESDLLRSADQAGIKTLVVAVDVPLHAKRERNIRSGWVRPYKPSPTVILEALRHPAWVLRYLRSGVPMMENFQPYASASISARDLTSFYASQVPTAHRWSLVHRLREQWKGRLVLKGVLTAEDARLAVDAGIDGLIVSNHGGRQLDRSIAAIDALPEVVAEVGNEAVVMFDSGIRRGSDVVVAMSLGAKLCFVGRAAAYGMAAFGTPGAQRAIDILRGELDLTLGQIGYPDVNMLGPEILWDKARQGAS